MGNAKVKIPPPGASRKRRCWPSMFGMGKQADQLVETMNHAAEQAVAEARSPPTRYAG